jgi:hypothetical protein
MLLGVSEWERKFNQLSESSNKQGIERFCMMAYNLKNTGLTNSEKNPFKSADSVLILGDYKILFCS